MAGKDQCYLDLIHLPLLPWILTDAGTNPEVFPRALLSYSQSILIKAEF